MSKPRAISSQKPKCANSAPVGNNAYETVGNRQVKFPLGAEEGEAVPHSLSWAKEPGMTASCFSNIVPTDRNGSSQVFLC